MLITALLSPALAGSLQFTSPSQLSPGQDPSLTVTLPRATATLNVQCQVGAETHAWSFSDLAAGSSQSFTWRDAQVGSAQCEVYALYADQSDEHFSIPLSYSSGVPLSVDIESTRYDMEAHTLTVPVTAAVDRAIIKALGAGGALLEEREIGLSAGPGLVELPWAGDPSEVVLLDITLYAGQSWAGLTFSPWYLEIPHEDVLFPTDSDQIPAAEEHKLKHTLRQLQDVLALYGDMVPVQLFIAGCTDTVGDAGSNLDLSNRRARAIARWLRSHGYSLPIFTYGYGESFLAVPTGDGVDEARNRRALYMVGASPPPQGSGVPPAQWQPL